MIEGISIDHVPGSWRHVPLGSFCDFSGGTQPPKSTFKDTPSNGYVRLLQIRDFETDKYAVYIPANKRLRIIESSDISIARYGASVGRILTGKSGAINVAIMTTHPDRSQVEKSFLGFALQHPDFQIYLTGLGGRAAQAGFNKGEVSRFKFPLPPLPEQRKIAGVLGVVQRAMEQQERLLALTAELKKALLHKLFTEGLRGEPQKQTEIGPVPESWDLVPCQDLCEMITVGVVVKPASHYVEKGVPAFRSFNVQEDRLATNDLVYFSETANDTTLAKSKLSAGDVLVVRTGYPGTSCVVPKEYHGANCIDLVIVRPKAGVIRSGFLSRYFNAPAGKSQAVAAKHGLAQQHLNVSAVKRTLVPVPSLEEQDEIDSELATVQRKIALITAKKDILTALFRTLMHQLMTAQIRVHDLDLEGLLAQAVAEMDSKS